MKLVYVPFEEAVDSEKYLIKMEHGWIQGYYDAGVIYDAESNHVCHGYYWQDMEWHPHKLYKIEEEEE